MGSSRPSRALVVTAFAALVVVVVLASTPWEAHGGDERLFGSDPAGSDAARADPAEVGVPDDDGSGAAERDDLPGPPDPRDYLDADGAFDAEAAAARAAHLDAGGLHEGLRAALARARARAAEDGLDIPVSSGYRSASAQARLLEAELAERGSWEAATRWVFTPDRSMHVRGLAIDIDSGPAADWLLVHGHRFGLCQTLSWEWWHFEWRERWEQQGSCPAPASTPSEAPGP